MFIFVDDPFFGKVSPITDIKSLYGYRLFYVGG